MPDLPTKTLSQEHYDRVVAVFPGADLAEKAVAYDAWLTNHLIDYVEEVELRALAQQFADEQVAAMAALSASLPPRVPFPPITP